MYNTTDFINKLLGDLSCFKIQPSTKYAQSVYHSSYRDDSIEFHSCRNVKQRLEWQQFVVFNAWVTKA